MSTKEKKLNMFQIGWLDDHGGRNINDVYYDEKGPYVLMTDGCNGDLRITIPVDNSVEIV